MELEENKDAVRRFLSALADDDRAVLRSLVHPDVAWWVPPIAEREQGIPRPLHGRDRVPWISGEGTTAFEPGSARWTIR